MRLSIAVATFLLLGSANALADDWTVVRVRGGVFALNDGQWEQLLRNSVVSDDRVIKSAPGGRATFVRGAETIEVGSDTTIQIDDSKRGFTTVYEHGGTVGVDAEARNVQHFAVQTPFVAAVVKGTAFVVETDKTSSIVAVSRGTVAVHDEHFGANVAVHAGSAIASSDDKPVTAASLAAIPQSMPKPPAPAAQQPAPAPLAQQPAPAPQAPQLQQPSAPPSGNPGPGKPGEKAAGPQGDKPGKGRDGGKGVDAGSGKGAPGKSADNGAPGNSGKGHGKSSDAGTPGNSGKGSGNSGNSNSGNGKGANASHGNGNSGNGKGNGKSGSNGPGDKGSKGNSGNSGKGGGK